MFALIAWSSHRCYHYIVRHGCINGMLIFINKLQAVQKCHRLIFDVICKDVFVFDVIISLNIDFLPFYRITPFANHVVNENIRCLPVPNMLLISLT